MVKQKFCYFFFDFREERPGVQPELERSQSCNFWGQKVLTRKLRMLLKVNTTLCLQSRCAVKWVLNTDRGFQAASWT